MNVIRLGFFPTPHFAHSCPFVNAITTDTSNFLSWSPFPTLSEGRGRSGPDLTTPLQCGEPEPPPPCPREGCDRRGAGGPWEPQHRARGTHFCRVRGVAEDSGSRRCEERCRPPTGRAVSPAPGGLAHGGRGLRTSGETPVTAVRSRHI